MPEENELNTLGRSSPDPRMVAFKPAGEHGPTVYRDMEGIAPEHVGRLTLALNPIVVGRKLTSSYNAQQCSTCTGRRSELLEIMAAGPHLLQPRPIPNQDVDGMHRINCIKPLCDGLEAPGASQLLWQDVVEVRHGFALREGLETELDDGSIQEPSPRDRTTIHDCGTVHKFKATTIVLNDQKLFPEFKVPEEDESLRVASAGLAEAVAKATKPGTIDEPSDALKKDFEKAYAAGLALDLRRLSLALCETASSDSCSEPPPCLKTCLPIAWEILAHGNGKVKQERKYVPATRLMHYKHWVEWAIHVTCVFVLICYPKMGVIRAPSR